MNGRKRATNGRKTPTNGQKKFLAVFQHNVLDLQPLYPMLNCVVGCCPCPSSPIATASGAIAWKGREKRSNPSGLSLAVSP